MGALLPVVLFVEDEPLVCLATDVLIDAGFKVIEAEDADDAQRLLNKWPSVEVIVTSVRLAGNADGIDEVGVMAPRLPGISIDSTSGHAPTSWLRLPEAAVCIDTAYSAKELANLVRQAMPGRSIVDLPQHKQSSGETANVG